jgi:hypothetical protein
MTNIVRSQKRGRAVMWKSLAGAFAVEPDLARSILCSGCDVRNSDQKVAVLVEALLPYASRYAQLTDRSFSLYPDIHSALGDSSVSVCMIDRANVSPELLQAASDPEVIAPRTSVPGFIIVGDPMTRRRRLLRHAFAYRLSLRADRGVRSGIYPLHDVPAEMVQNHDRLAGANASASVILQTLTEPCALLSMATHCDGIDAYIADKVAMCGLPTWHADASIRSATRKPRCLETDYCHRHDMRLSDVDLSPTIVDPGSICAGLLLWDVCFGVLPSGDFIDPRFSLIENILDRATVGAIVTTFENSFTHAAACEQMADALCSGDPVGTALRRYLLSREARSKGRRYVLIGDPELRVSTASGLLGSIGFQEEDGETKINTRSGHRSALYHAGLDQTGDDRALIDSLQRRGRLYDLWTPVANLGMNNSNVVCPTCSRRCRTFRSAPDAPFRMRDLVLCTNCGIIADRPCCESALLSHEQNGVFRLHGGVTGKVRSAALQISFGSFSANKCWPWPIDRQGDPATRVHCPERLPPGVFRASGIFFHGEEVTLISAMARVEDR